MKFLFFFDQVTSGLELRRQQLLKEVKEICDHKYKILTQQHNDLTASADSIGSGISQMELLIQEDENQARVLVMKRQLATHLKSVDELKLVSGPKEEDDGLCFITSPHLIESLSNIGQLQTRRGMQEQDQLQRTKIEVEKRKQEQQEREQHKREQDKKTMEQDKLRMEQEKMRMEQEKVRMEQEKMNFQQEKMRMEQEKMNFQQEKENMKQAQIEVERKIRKDKEAKERMEQEKLEKHKLEKEKIEQEKREMEQEKVRMKQEKDGLNQEKVRMEQEKKTMEQEKQRKEQESKQLDAIIGKCERVGCGTDVTRRNHGEICKYHPGKPWWWRPDPDWRWSCCGGRYSSPGCAQVGGHQVAMKKN